MSNANITLVQSLYAAFGRGDIASLLEGLAPNIDWRINGRKEDYPLLGDWRGKGEVEKFFAELAEQEEVIEFSPREFLGADDRVFVLGRYAWKIRKTGRTVDSEWVHVHTVRDGKVAKFREFTDTAQFAQAYRG